MEQWNGFRIAELMAKESGGGLTPGEREELDAWMTESEHNREAYRRFVSGETRRRRDAGLAGHDTERSVAQLRRRIRRHKVRTTLVRTASAAVVAAGIFSAVYFLRPGMEDAVAPALAERQPVVMSVDDGATATLAAHGNETEWQAVAEAMKGGADPKYVPGNIRIEVPRGNAYKLRLADGTAVWLNAETTIEYPEKFDDGVRGVRLRGEAFFDVAHNAEHPFVITTQDGVEVTVLGTRFNVQSYDDGDRVSVTLAEGSVEVQAGGRRSLLKPAQQAVFNRQTGAMTVHDVENMRLHTAWIDGEFYLEDTIGAIFAAMEKRYGIDIIYDPAGTENLGRFIVKAGGGENFTVILNALRKITGMTYRVEDGGVFVAFPAE